MLIGVFCRMRLVGGRLWSRFRASDVGLALAEFEQNLGIGLADDS
jgi:hypothetical protein